MIGGKNTQGGRMLFSMSALAVLILLAVSSRAAGSKANSEVVSEWQEASFNYEYAAEAQELAADATLSQARKLRAGPAEDTGTLRRGKIQAGNLEVRAADLLVAASTNLDHAARSWRQAAAAAGRDSASYAYFVTTADSSAGKATLLLRRAADLCEQAAAGLAAEDELLSQAAANQKAGAIRERLATRRQ